VPTFEPLGRPGVHVGPEVPLHRRRGRAELRRLLRAERLRGLPG